jgi:hypothetical protein
MKRTPGLIRSGIPAILLLALAGGCIGINAPDWIGGSSRDYPNGAFLIGVGTGDTRESAEQEALTALARIFKTDVRQETRELERYIQRDAGRRALMTRSVNIKQLTRVTSDKVLEGAEIEAVWRHPETGRYYALALIDRVHAESLLLDRIRDIDRAVKTYLDPTRTSGDKIQTVRAMNQAIKALLLRETANADLRIISPSGRGMVPPVTLARVSGDLQSYLEANLRMGVEVDGPHAGPIRSAILKNLSEKGFALAQSGPAAGGPTRPPDLLIKGTVAFEPVDRPDNAYVRWHADFQILEPATGRILGGLVKSGREGHLNAVEAKSRAVRTVQKDFAAAFTQYLIDLLYGEAELPG